MARCSLKWISLCILCGLYYILLQQFLSFSANSYIKRLREEIADSFEDNVEDIKDNFRTNSSRNETSELKLKAKDL